MHYNDQIKLVKKEFKKLGFKTTNGTTKTTNGADLFAIKGDCVKSVEIKLAKKPSEKANVLRVRAVEKAREQDDFVAIIINEKYVLIEPMRDHLKCVNKKSGDRFLNIYSEPAPKRGL